MSASSGHSVNQSMVEQLMSEGNMRSLVVNWLPSGLMTMIMWMFLLTLMRYCVKMLTLVGWMFFFTQSPLQVAVMSYMSFSW